MSAAITDRIVYLLGQSPAGLTTADLAACIGAPSAVVSSQCSKLADYGRINRDFERASFKGGAVRFCRWSAKRIAQQVVE